MIYERYSECRTWYVVFDSPKEARRRWWRLFTGARFAHCWAFSEAGQGIMRVEPLAWGLCCMYEAVDIEQMLRRIALTGCTAMLSITVDYRLEAREDVRRGVFTCVSALKALLAMRRCRLIVTPFQLYKRLCRHEGCIAVIPFIPYVGRHAA